MQRRHAKNQAELDALWDALKENVLLKSRALEEQRSKVDAASSLARLAEGELAKPIDGTVSDGSLVTAASSRKRPYGVSHCADGASSSTTASRKRTSIASDEPRKRARLRAPTVSGSRVCGVLSKQASRGEK